MSKAGELFNLKVIIDPSVADDEMRVGLKGFCEMRRQIGHVATFEPYRLPIVDASVTREQVAEARTRVALAKLSQAVQLLGEVAVAVAPVAGLDGQHEELIDLHGNCSRRFRRLGATVDSIHPLTLDRDPEGEFDPKYLPTPAVQS